MPGTLLYTIIVEESRDSYRGGLPRVTFELSEDTFKQAFADQAAKRAERHNKYQLYLGSPKAGDVIPDYAIYLGEKDQDCIIYELGQKRRLVSFTFPDTLLSDLSKENLEKHKSIILETLLGPPKNFMIHKHVDAYLYAYVNPSMHNTDPSYTRTHGSISSKNIVIKGPDNLSRDATLNVLSAGSDKPANETYRYIVTQEKGQITLTMDVPKDTHGARAGLASLKNYARKLLPVLGIEEKDQDRYPKIEITGKGAKGLYNERPIDLTIAAEKRFMGAFMALSIGGMIFFAGFLVAINPVASGILIAVGALALIGGGVLAYQGVRNMWRTPKRDLSWHQNELAEAYKDFFARVSASSTLKPGATTNAQIRSAGTDVNTSSIPASVATVDTLKKPPSGQKPKTG